MAVSAEGKLYYRMSDALGGYDVTPDEREQILEAWRNAGGEMAATWDKMSLGSRKLIEDIEKRAPQSWDDPADLPDQKGI
jgi:hypothetical protein